jgi:hypothetical protein
MISLFLALNTATVQPMMAAAPPSAAIEQPSSVASATGLIFETNIQKELGKLNIGKLIQSQVTYVTEVQTTGVEYVDRCGKDQRAIGWPHSTGGGGTTVLSSGPVQPYYTKQAKIKGWFVSEKTPPSPGLRVVVRNMSLSKTSEPIPYSDREYDKGSRSEGFVAGLETEHQSRFLALQPGVNQFTYEIKRGEQVIETGQFTADIAHEVKDISITKTHGPRQESLPCEDKHDDKHKDGKKKHHRHH